MFIFYLSSCTHSTFCWVRVNMADRPSCASSAYSYNWRGDGTRTLSDTPTSIIIPFCPHLPHHILLRAWDPQVQAELSMAVHSILVPQWLSPSPYGRSYNATPPNMLRNIWSSPNDLFSSSCSKFDFDDMQVAAHSPEIWPSAPVPYGEHSPHSSHCANQTYVPLNVLEISTPAALQGLSPSSQALSMPSWDSQTHAAACALADSLELVSFSVPQAIVKPTRFRSLKYPPCYGHPSFNYIGTKWCSSSTFGLCSSSFSSENDRYDTCILQQCSLSP